MSKSRDQWRGMPPATDGEDTQAPRPRWVAKGDPTIRWGDQIVFTQRVGGAVGIAQAGDFMRVTLPTPRVCSLAFNASLVIDPPGSAGVIIDNVTFEFFVGLGSARYSRFLGFVGLPTATQELDAIVTHLPLNTLYVRASSQIIIGAATSVDLVITGQLSPIAPFEAFDEAPTMLALSQLRAEPAATVSGDDYDDDEDDEDV